LTLACLVCVIGTYMFTGTTIFWVAATGRFLVGFGSAFAFVGVLKIATLWLPENRCAMISGMTSALGPIGAMLGDNFLELFIVKMGWVKTLNMTAAFGIVLTLVLWVGIRDRKAQHRQSGTVPTLKKGLVDLGIIITSRQIWVN
ncbi:MFS transporter, partial [Pseudomonas aeruginosa]|uniref:MFS transporter n=1 Tax=Pseudomonas aeruginosa TaxID=287 RepID=UPI003CFB29EC